MFHAVEVRLHAPPSFQAARPLNSANNTPKNRQTFVCIKDLSMVPNAAVVVGKDALIPQHTTHSNIEQSTPVATRVVAAVHPLVVEDLGCHAYELLMRAIVVGQLEAQDIRIRTQKALHHGHEEDGCPGIASSLERLHDGRKLLYISCEQDELHLCLVEQHIHRISTLR